MPAIRDARTMHGSRRHVSPDTIKVEWERWVRYGPPGRPETTEPERTGETSSAYVSDGRWVADCLACNGGIAVWSGLDEGCCYDCGRVWLIEFPPPGDVARAEVVLSKRPLSGNQNWLPHKGETVNDLKAENAVRGLDFTDDMGVE